MSWMNEEEMVTIKRSTHIGNVNNIIKLEAKLAIAMEVLEQFANSSNWTNMTAQELDTKHVIEWDGESNPLRMALNALDRLKE